ncbi:MAG TPA: hypothetical protein ENN17_05315 [bacterium]|nr:hypothetical protein [bacterium]
MVDINLFDEGFEDQSDSSPEQRPSGSSDAGRRDNDDFSGDLNLGDDLSDDAGLGGDTLLDGDETLPDFEEEEEGLDDDYTFEGSGPKKSPPWLLIGVGLFAVAAVLFIYVIYPTLNKPVAIKLPKPKPPATKPVAVRPVQPAETAPAQPTDQEQTPETIRPAVEGRYDVLAGTRTVFENLSAQGQAGVVIINNNRYLVEYVSKTPGVADAMGQRIQTLFGADNYAVSPEERHRTAGQDNYWGVVSGTLPPFSAHAPSPGANPYPTMTSFHGRIKTLCAQHGIALQSIAKPAGIVQQPKQHSSGHMIIEGEKKNVFAFMHDLKQIEGHWGVSKLLLAPADIADFHASRVKMGITFWVEIG